MSALVRPTEFKFDLSHQYTCYYIYYYFSALHDCLSYIYRYIDPNAALPQAFANKDLPWINYIVSIGALCGMTTTLFGSLFSLPRCMYAMSSDGLLFSFLGNVNEKTQVSQLPLINFLSRWCFQPSSIRNGNGFFCENPATVSVKGQNPSIF